MLDITRAHPEMAQVRTWPLRAPLLGCELILPPFYVQVDRREDGKSLRCATQHDIPTQRDASEPPRRYRHTREARDI